MKLIGRGFVIFVLISILLLICGCIEDNSPKRIYFSASNIEEGYLKLYFSLENSQGEPVYCDGDIEVKIKDDLGKILYSNTFHVNASDFNYPYTTSENIIVMSCELTIPLSDIEEGTSQIGIGKAYLTFRTTDGITLKTYIPV